MRTESIGGACWSVAYRCVNKKDERGYSKHTLGNRTTNLMFCTTSRTAGEVGAVKLV